MVRNQVFISYSHADEAWKDYVVKHLKVLVHEGLYNVWDDRRISAGADWVEEIKTALAACNVALLLISANFLTSEFILGNEVPALLQRREQEGVRVIPVILKPCSWTRLSWLKSIQAHPKDGKALNGMNEHDVDAALTALTEEVADLLQLPPVVLPTIPNIHGWSAAQVQALQQQTAKALKVSVEFRDRLKDGSLGPAMVVIPAGEFLMGSPEDEPGRQNNEGPQHKVVIAKPFAMGRYAVTFEEYDRFCEATGQKKPHDEGWGRGRRPVIWVAWEEAVDYCAWLSRETGAIYRLPSEAEWEYAARARTTTAFWWGDDIDTTRANYHGDSVYRNGPKGEYRQQTVPVDTFQPNPFGLYQMHGNIWEWVQDSWHGNYDGAPVDGSAWVEKKVSPYVVRGGSWNYAPFMLRGAARHAEIQYSRNYYRGFRLARTFP